MSGVKFRLYDTAGSARLLDAMARRAASLIDGRPATLIGVLRRGAPLADLLAARLGRIAPDLAIQRMDLKVKRYSDDLQLLHPDTALQLEGEQQAASFAGRVVIVVDDVLYQGFSAQRVLEFLRGREAEAIHLAVLVDRLARRLPVVADIVGATLQIAPDDVIECNVPPYEPEFAVDLWRPKG
jgi:pyrimidine operon attenuation protein / uracil phosphoribosyltransferase